MIFGIGTDIVEYARIETLYARHGARFARRVLSDAELIELARHAQPARFLAKRFAAKEALAKAIGSGLRHPVTMPRITISHDDLGKPVLQFDELLRQYLSLAGGRGHHLSISDERSMMIAFVVLEG